MENQIESAQGSSESISQYSVSISDFSDEILLHILSYVPSHDLVLSVSHVCRKLHTLCQDKSLISHIQLQKEYTASDETVKKLLKELSSDVQALDASGCYWLTGSTMDFVTRCVGLVRLDVSGWRVTPARLSRLLSSLRLLRSLGLDIEKGFDLQRLSAEGKAALAQLSELKQTLLTPSYGVVPCCGALQSLSLYLEVAEGWHEPSSCLQLIVGQSSVPRYNNLQWFSARLAPGEVNRALLSLYLAAFSMRVPEGLTGLVVAMPGPASSIPASTGLLTQGILSAGSVISAFQLPQTLLDGATLRRVLEYGCPAYLNVSRCAAPGFEPLCVLLGAGCDLSPLRSLNIRGKMEEEVDAEGIRILTKLCPQLAHFNLTSTHYHHSTLEMLDQHLCWALGQLRNLRSLALPACALAQGPRLPENKPDLATKLSSESLFLGLKKNRRIGVPIYQPMVDSTAGLKEGQEGETVSILCPLVNGCSYLVELEVIGTGFLSLMPRNERVMCRDPSACPWSYKVGDAQLAALGKLRFLRRLTLAHLPGVLKGTGLLELALGCKDLQVLSLANLGSLKAVTYTLALQESFKYLTQLREIRLEQPYFSANMAFFDALTHCRLLQRFCLVSRHGTFHHSSVVSFMRRCKDIVMLHMFTGDTLVACKTLQKTLLDSCSTARPALSVVVYPLLHEDLGNVIREMPLCHLDEITLFKTRVAEDPTVL